MRAFINCVAFIALAGHSLAQAENLAEVFALAQQNDALIHSQEATYKAGQETVAIARSALLPQIGFEASSSDTSMDDHQNTQSYDTDSTSKSFTASQTLFNLESWHNYRNGKQSSNQAEAQFESDEQELIIRVVQAYTDILATIDQYKTAKAEETALARQLDQTKQRFDVGLAAITDVYESQASYDSAAVNILNAKGSIGIAFEALDAITGVPVKSIAPLSDSFQVKQPEPLAQENWVTSALANNAELKAAEFSMQAALQNAKAKTAAHYPTVTANYRKIDSETDANIIGSGADQDFNRETLSIDLKVPLFAGGGISATRRQAWAQYNAANEQFIYATRKTTQAARSYYLAVTTGVARVGAQYQAILSSQSALDATQAGYEAGTRNIVDVLDAERALYNTQRLWHEARYRYINDLLQLRKVAGTLEPKVIDIANQSIETEQQIDRSEFN